MIEITRVCPVGGQVVWHDTLRTGVSRIFHVEGVMYAELLAVKPSGDEWLLLRFDHPMEINGESLTLVGVTKEKQQVSLKLNTVTN